MSHLLPCPFCGGKAETLLLGNSKVILRCVDCCVQRTGAVKRFSVEWLERKMREWWNTRAATSVDVGALSAKLARYEKALLECYELIKRDYEETDPTNGIAISKTAEPAWTLVCNALGEK